jgi:chromate reductase, NAD(P)H dehydrogenase (quinone)
MHTPTKKVLAICGSTRQQSTNHRYIKAIAAMSAGYFEVLLFDGLSALPHFNPDEDKEQVDETVARFRQLLVEADGVLICTPEYAHGIPGTLKNAIDWTVSSNEFSGKPTMLVTASTDGSFAHKALLETLRVIEAKDIEQNQLLIQFAATKINSENQVTDAPLLTALKQLVENFKNTIMQVPVTGI